MTQKEAVVGSIRFFLVFVSFLFNSLGRICLCVFLLPLLSSVTDLVHMKKKPHRKQEKQQGINFLMCVLRSLLYVYVLYIKFMYKPRLHLEKRMT